MNFDHRSFINKRSMILIQSVIIPCRQEIKKLFKRFDLFCVWRSGVGKLGLRFFLKSFFAIFFTKLFFFLLILIAFSNC